MKRIIVVALMTFLVAMAIGISTGLLRDSLKMGLIMGRALLSALGAVGVVVGAQVIIQKIFPELLAPVDEQDLTSDESDEGIRASEEMSVNIPQKERGNKIDVTLDDPIQRDHYTHIDITGLSDDSVENPSEVDDDNRRKLTPESFYHEDPRDLAAAVRTTLSRDES